METTRQRICSPLASLAILTAGWGFAAEAPLVENLVNVSWGDQIMVARGDAALDTPARIERSIRSWARDWDIQTVLWRVAAYYIRDFYERRELYDFAKSYYRKVEQTLEAFDPAAIARAATRANGQRFLVYMTIYDHGAPTTCLYGGSSPFPWQDRFTIEHPEFQAVDLQGGYHYGVLEMAYPECRALMVERIRSYVERFQADGVYVCTRSHSLPALHADQFGFSEPVVAEYRRRFGIDITRDPRFDWRSPAYAPGDPALENWRRLRGEYLIQFYRDLRAALPKAVIYTGLPRGRYLGPPYGNLYLDWESLADERLVDGIVLGVHSGKGLHPPLYVPHRGIGYLSSSDDGIAIPSFQDCVDTIYGPRCREKGIKLFLQGGLGSAQKRWAAQEPRLTGFMSGVPAGAGAAILGDDPLLDFPGGQMTVEAFVFASGAPDRHSAPRILSKYSHDQDNALRGWEWMLLGDGRFRFRVNQVEPGAAGKSGDRTLDSREPFPLRRWVHVATVFDGPNRRIRLYLDGQLAAGGSIPDWPLRRTEGQDLYLGRYGGGSMQVFSGMLDELRLTAAALEFTAPPAAPYAGDEGKVVALYHFDSLVDGTTVLNEVGGGGVRTALRGLGDNLLGESMPGFGRALSLLNE